MTRPSRAGPALTRPLEPALETRPAGLQAPGLGVGHDKHALALEAHHLAQGGRAVVQVQEDAGAHGQHQALGLGHQAHHLGDAPQVHQGVGLQEGLAVVGQPAGHYQSSSSGRAGAAAGGVASEAAKASARESAGPGAEDAVAAGVAGWSGRLRDSSKASPRAASRSRGEDWW